MAEPTNSNASPAALRTDYDRRSDEVSHLEGHLPDPPAAGGPGGGRDLPQPAASVSDLRHGSDGRGKWADSGSSASVRVAEIRQENADGDVSHRDIAWLCGVAEAASRLVAAGRGSRELAEALSW